MKTIPKPAENRSSDQFLLLPILLHLDPLLEHHLWPKSSRRYFLRDLGLENMWNPTRESGLGRREKRFVCILVRFHPQKLWLLSDS